MNIVDFIPKGRENAVSMEELAHRIGCDEQKIYGYYYIINALLCQ